ALVAAKEKELVLDDRPAERSAKLMAQQTVVLPLAVRPDRRKLIGRVEPFVPVELEQVPVDDVGARLRHRIDRSARAHTVVGGESAGRDPELLQRIRERKRQAAAALRVVVDGAVEQVGDAEILPTGDADAHPAAEM